MALLITAVLAIAVAGVVALGVALAVRSKREFAAQNEVVPGRPSPAPASWAGAHSPEAKLHRRLGDAVRGARANPRFVELGLAAQMAAIEAEAMAIDERLVAAAHLPAGHREPAVAAMETHVAQLEATIAEMVSSITIADSKQQLEAAVSAADIKLQALAEARAEVERIDSEILGAMPAATQIVEQPQAFPTTSQTAPPAPATPPAPPHDAASEPNSP